VEGGNAYQLLQEIGVLLVEGDTATPVLSGGSYCRTELRQEYSDLRVRKSVAAAKEHSYADVDLKFLREQEMLSSLPASALELFPKILRSGCSDGRYFYEQNFFFGYSLGEMVLQDRLNATALIEWLRRLFGSLLDHVYGLEAIRGDRSCQEESIQDRVIRRFDLMSRASDDVGLAWRHLLEQDTLVVNGVELEGWPSLARWLATNTVVARSLHNGPPELCHGDLIFDDILILPSEQRFLLIDPNGDAMSRHYDAAKTMLSTWSLYELFKFDRFRCEVRGKSITIRLAPEHKGAIHVLEAANCALPGIWKSLGLWDTQYLEPAGGAALLRNGLHNLGLPMFHLMHHRNSARATAFLAIGILRLNQARRALEDYPSASLEEVTNSFLLSRLLS
jgi:hypothetical protein